MARAHSGSMVVPFQNVSLKLSQKTALLIIVPLCVQFVFLGLLLTNLSETEREAEAEARSAEALSQISYVFNYALSAAGSIATGRARRDEHSKEEFEANLAELVHHRDILARLPQAGPAQSKEVEAFIAMTDETRAMLLEALNLDENNMNLRGLAKLTNFISRISKTG